MLDRILHFNFPHYVPGKLKFIYWINVYQERLIKSSNHQTTMASYIQKFLGLSTWMMNPTATTTTTTTNAPLPEANVIPAQHFKNKKSMRVLNTMMTTARERAAPANAAEMGTQVQVSSPPTIPPLAQATIETQTIENPELLTYTDEQLIGHYTHQLFQCEHASAATSVTSVTSTTSAGASIAHEDQTLTCSVCLETLKGGDKNTTLTPCGHAYHLSCLLTSLRNKNLCPMCRGSLEDPRPKPSTTNTLVPSNAEQIIRDELYWFPKSAHILNIRGSNHPKRAFKDSLRTFAYAVLQTTAEFVHAENVPDEWYSEDETEDEEDEDDNTENDENDENSENSDNDENDENDQNAETDDNDENHTDEETDNQDNLNPRQEYHIDEQHVSTRGVNIARMNMRLRSSSRRGGDFYLRNVLP
jgi:hypothetical protein